MVVGDQTYLAKNNNHLLRAKSLHQMDMEAGLRICTIIPFREPYSQAKSLLTQHRNLSTLQRENDFALDYMDFLVHHEFGVNTKTHLLRESAGEALPQGDMDTIEHWLEVWRFFYRAAFDLYKDQPGFCFFCYEHYLEKPRESLLSLSSFLQIPPEQLTALEVKQWTGNRSEMAAEPIGEIMALYREMTNAAINHDV